MCASPNPLLTPESILQRAGWLCEGTVTAAKLSSVPAAQPSQVRVGQLRAVLCLHCRLLCPLLCRKTLGSSTEVLSLWLGRGFE